MQDEKWHALQEQVRELMEETATPGVVVGLWHEGQEQIAAFGVTSVDNPLSVSDETLFQVGSITKTFTALLIMRLVEQGKLNLDAPVRDYLPDFQVADREATSNASLRHLLTHTAGWEGDLFVDTGAGKDAGQRYLAAMVDLEQVAPIGTYYSYNNAGFYLAGAIIEAVTGKSYQQAVRELVLEPLGLEQIYFDPGDVMTYRFVVGHRVNPEGEAEVARPWPLPRAAYPVGGITTNAHQLLDYARFQMGDGTSATGERLVQPETLQRMHTARVPIRGDVEWIGLAWFIDKLDDSRVISHGGGTVGQVSLLLFVPERNFALVILTNADRGGLLSFQLHRWVLRTYLGLESPLPEPQDVPEETLQAHIGHYTRSYSDIDLYLEEGQLMARMTPKRGFPSPDVPPPPPPPPAPIAVSGEDRLLVTAGPYKDTQAEIIRRPDGSIGWLRMGRLYRRVDEKNESNERKQDD